MRTWPALFLLLAGCAAPTKALVGAQEPNILLILLDDLGKEWVECFGGEAGLTPNLSRLAAEGMCMDNGYVMPQCTPTRVSLLTGQYPFRHGWVNHWDVPRWGHGAHFDPDQNPSLARNLRAAGYSTVVAGKWQINDFRVQPDVLDRHGFEDWCMWTGFETGVSASRARYQDPYVCTPEGSATRSGEFGPDVFTEALMLSIKARDGRPFFAYYPMVLTHTPFVATPLEPESEGRLPRHRAMVRYADHCIGRLLDTLDEEGLTEETLVIVLSDNGTVRNVTGQLRGSEVRGGKGTSKESGVCVPWIVRWTGQIAPDSRSSALVDVTDLFPSLLELARAPAPGGWYLDGRSMVLVLLGERSASAREWIMAMGGQPAALSEAGWVVPQEEWRDRVLRDERWKLCMGSDREPEALFDLSVDPLEQRNLLTAPDPEAEQALQRLRAVSRVFPARDAAPRYRKLPARTWDWQGARRR